MIFLICRSAPRWRWWQCAALIQENPEIHIVQEDRTSDSDEGGAQVSELGIIRVGSVNPLPQPPF